MKIQAGEYNAVLFEKRRWGFVNWSRKNTFVNDKKHVLYLAKELQNYVEGIPDAQLKAMGYHFLAFQSMKTAFDTKEKTAVPE